MSTIFKNTVYRRDGETGSISLRGVGETELSSPPEFGGKTGVLSPEEMFVGSINGCLMLTFFFFAKKFDVEVTSYHSDAEGEIEKGNEGFKFAKVIVKAKVTVAKDKHFEKIEEISHLAEKYCLVSNSVICPVSYKVEVTDKGSAKGG
ncbi:MAG: OsmC family protein [Sedimentisphaerales bacterium]|nr:OsmC family protein [Sedimentisphaerales bacterium]